MKEELTNETATMLIVLALLEEVESLKLRMLILKIITAILGVLVLWN